MLPYCKLRPVASRARPRHLCPAALIGRYYITLLVAAYYQQQLLHIIHNRRCSAAGKWCLVTGGGTGIGRAIATALAAHGCKLLLVARRAEKLQETSELCRSQGAGQVGIIAARLHAACPAACSMHADGAIATTRTGACAAWCTLRLYSVLLLQLLVQSTVLPGAREGLGLSVWIRRVALPQLAWQPEHSTQ